MQRHGGRCLLGPVRADQSELTGRVKNKAFQQVVNRGATAVDFTRIIMCFFNIKTC